MQGILYVVAEKSSDLFLTADISVSMVVKVFFLVETYLVKAFLQVEGAETVLIGDLEYAVGSEVDEQFFWMLPGQNSLSP